MQALGQLGSKSLAHDLGVHGLGENLHRENVVVAIDDEAGQEIGFAEDHAVGIGVVDDRLAIGDGIGDALAQQRREIGDRLVRDQADGDLRGAGIERGAEGLAAMIGDGDQRAGRRRRRPKRCRSDRPRRGRLSGGTRREGKS